MRMRPHLILRRALALPVSCFGWSGINTDDKSYDAIMLDYSHIMIHKGCGG